MATCRRYLGPRSRRIEASAHAGLAAVPVSLGDVYRAVGDNHQFTCSRSQLQRSLYVSYAETTEPRAIRRNPLSRTARRPPLSHGIFTPVFRSLGSKLAPKNVQPNRVINLPAPYFTARRILSARGVSLPFPLSIYCVGTSSAHRVIKSSPSSRIRRTGFSISTEKYFLGIQKPRSSP